MAVDRDHGGDEPAAGVEVPRAVHPLVYGVVRLMEMSEALLALVVMLCVFFAALTIWAVAATVGDLVDRWAVAKMEELKKENERLKKSLGEKEKENEDEQGTDVEGDDHL